MAFFDNNLKNEKNAFLFFATLLIARLGQRTLKGHKLHPNYLVANNPLKVDSIKTNKLKNPKTNKTAVK